MNILNNISQSKRKTISLREDIYKRISAEGQFGESFSDVLERAQFIKGAKTNKETIT